MQSEFSYAENIDLHDEPVRLSVQQLTLSAFRNYPDLRIELDEAPVILTGPNGSGKTNLLEALSLLVPGRGFRHASLGTFQNKDMAQPWAVAAEVATTDGRVLIGTGRATDLDDETDKRIVRIDGRPVKSQQVLAHHIAMTWITPDMDRVLSEGPSARRKLLDRLVYSFDPAHAGRVQKYEKAMRERLYLLREGGGDNAWFTALENAMAQSGVAIAAARLQMAEQLQTAMHQTQGAFPQALVRVDGFAEEMLGSSPALLVEDRLRGIWAASRREDATNGTCATGPHRSDLKLVHKLKNCPADLCSTGEQKALLIAVMLAYVRTLTQARNMVPLLLLDDIASHLDAVRREALFDEINSLKIQAWLTGTDPFQFSPLLKNVQSFSVASGVVTQI